MLAKRSILKSIVIIFISIWFTDVDAAIYKWRDESGITHFTDNPTNVPKAYREKPFIKKIIPQRINAVHKKRNIRGKGDENLGKEEPAKDTIKAVKKKEGLTEAQRLVIEKALNFLHVDIPRYEKYYTYPPSRSKFRVLKQVVSSATVEKQELLGQVKEHNIPVFKEIYEYLDESIAKDKKSQKVMPTTITSTRQTLILINRLKSETEKGKQLISKLNYALKIKK
jgi:hypothetical protein